MKYEQLVKIASPKALLKILPKLIGKISRKTAPKYPIKPLGPIPLSEARGPITIRPIISARPTPQPLGPIPLSEARGPITIRPIIYK